MRLPAAGTAVLLALTFLASDAEAKRLGGGSSSGMQRQSTQAAPAAQPGTPAAAAAPAQAGAPAAAPGATAATRRGWGGPLATLAAGLGLAALASAFGFGEGLATVLLIVLLGMAAMGILGFLLRRRAAEGVPPPMADVDNGATGGPAASGARSIRFPAVSGARGAFDEAGFIRGARSQFLALQAANDAGDLDKLRGYLSAPMFDVVRAEVQARGAAPQHTDVFGLHANVVEVTAEHGQHVVSVRFTGRIRLAAGDVPDDLDELWHLAKPRLGNEGWIVVGIQQMPQAAAETQTP